MNIRIVALLALLGLLLLAGCSFKSNSDDDGSDTTFSAGSTDDDDKDSPSASIGAVLSVLGVALVVRRRLGGSGAA
jgi:drug/metabolite transporter (DMT)-like permease